MTRRALIGSLAWLLAAAGALAHELEANRLTLVLRDRNHLAMTLFIDYAEALHRVLAPGRTFQEFALVHSAMTPQDLGRELLRAQARFESGTRLVLADGSLAGITNWKWPDAARVQAMLQQRVMQSIVAPGDHVHEAPVEIRAEATSPQDIGAVTVQLPEEFRRVLVVWYRPGQVWVEPGAPSPAIRF